MAKNTRGRFIVSELPDGRYVAASSSAPFFCFRAASEEEVLAKVKRAVTFCQSQTVKKPNVTINQAATVSQQITSLTSGRAYELNDVLEAA